MMKVPYTTGNNCIFKRSEAVPTYEYKCRDCGHEFELFQYMSDEPVKTCPRCGGPVQRLIGTGGGVIFKGNGFYATDYRSESYKKAEKSEKTTAAPKTASKKTDSASSRKEASESKKTKK